MKATTHSEKAQLNLKYNVEYQLRDKNGKIKQLFQDNRFFSWLMKMGIVSPHFFKIPFLLGNWSDKKIVANLVTSTGKAGAASRINGSGSEAAFTFIGVGTGVTAVAVGNTTIETEITDSGLARVAGTASRVTTSVTNDTAQLTTTFSVTGTKAVTESGLLNAASVGVLLCRQVFSAINVVNLDSLTITWKVQAS